MRIIEVEQGSPEWFFARCGIPSASNFDKIVCADGKPSKQREKYLYELAGERVTGIPSETYQNGDMLRGKELEDEARKLYALISGTEPLQTGFCLEEGYGCSPDGFVARSGILELKCPKISTHVGYFLANELPKEYFQQVQGQLLVTGRKWCDFMSYYPGLRPFIIRVKPDKPFLAKLQSELKLFCKELAEVAEKIK